MDFSYYNKCINVDALSTLLKILQNIFNPITIHQDLCGDLRYTTYNTFLVKRQSEFMMSYPLLEGTMLKNMVTFRKDALNLSQHQIVYYLLVKVTFS